ncbi:helix-turn-helix transcriptional regulator [Streptomyces griseorubiginosus]|uniref:helix-turn-helix domain-containing protein n=1 Tax=Streptomyces griseorubiginosus TaxID=67304 RepID=UPI0033A63371
MAPVPSRVFSGTRFKQLRKERGIKGSTISRRTGIPECTLSAWAVGHNLPSLDKLILVADVLGCSLEDFLVPCGEVASDAGVA